MTEIETTAAPLKHRAVRPDSNVYSVLVFVTFAALVMGVVVMWVKNVGLTGTSNPFTIVP